MQGIVTFGNLCFIQLSKMSVSFENVWNCCNFFGFPTTFSNLFIFAQKGNKFYENQHVKTFL